MFDVGELYTGLDEEVEADVHHNLALDQQLVGFERQRVEGCVDRPLDHVLDGGEPVVDLASLSGPQYLDDAAGRTQFELGEVRLVAQGLLGEGAGRAKVGDRSGMVAHGGEDTTSA